MSGESLPDISHKVVDANPTEPSLHVQPKSTPTMKSPGSVIADLPQPPQDLQLDPSNVDPLFPSFDLQRPQLQPRPSAASHPPTAPSSRPVASPQLSFPHSEVHKAMRNQIVLVLSNDGTGLTKDQVDLLRDADDVERAYQRMESRPPVELRDGNGVLRGRMIHARVLQRVPNAETQLKTFQRTRNQVIIKQLLLRYVVPYLKQGGTDNPYNEIAVMQRYGDGMHIIECSEALQDRRCLYIITPYHRHGDLNANIIWGRGGLRCRTQMRVVMRRLVENIVFIRDNELIHHGLSPQHVLVDDDRAVFPMIGFANQPRGKPSYMAPEVAFGGQIGEPVHVWILGVIFFNFCTGLRPYESPGDRNFARLQFEGLFNDPRIQGLHPDAMDLLDRMMKWLPQDRIPSDEILAHPWFTAEGGD